MPIRRRDARRVSILAGLSRALVVAALCSLSCGAMAAFWYDPKTDEWFWREKDWGVDFLPEIKDSALIGLSLFVGKPPPSIESGSGARLASIPADIRSGVYQIDTGSFTVESGEPLAYPAMKRTGWRLFVADRSGRVVVSTYGSVRFGTPLDTAIGVYKKSADGSGKLIARSDDVAVAGGYGGASFAAFDAVKGASYAIQFGDVGSDGGDVLVTVTTFGAGGGLVVQPISPYDGYDHSCTRNVGQSGTCLPRDYVVYNATDSTLRVSATATGLGAGAKFPKAFTLEPGAAALKTISFDERFGSDGKALSGGFIFAGEKGGAAAARTIVPARVAIHDNAGPPATLKIASRATTVAVPQSSVVPQILDVSNVGPAAAKSCYVKPGLNETLMQTAWAGYDGEKNLVSTEPYAPFDIAPGKTVSIVVAMRALRDRLADPAFERPFEIACANGPSFPSAGPDLTDVLDFTASVKPFADVSLVATSPKSGVFAIASKGSVMTASFRNDGEADIDLTAKVVERTIHPFGDPKRYKVSLCSSKTTDAACLSSTTADLDVTARAGTTLTLKVAVKPPAEDPGYDPKLIGLALTLSQTYGETFSTQIPISGVTKALKLK